MSESKKELKDEELIAVNGGEETDTFIQLKCPTCGRIISFSLSEYDSKSPEDTLHCSGTFRIGQHDVKKRLWLLP